MKNITRRNKLANAYLFVLLISIITIIVGLFQTDWSSSRNYSDFSSNWYSNNNKVNLSNVYKYKEINKKLPNLNKDYQIYMNVKSINIDVYIEDECIYKYEDYNKELFGKTPGSYFVKLNIDRRYAGKQLTIKVDNAYNDESGKITEIYIGESIDVVLDFVANHLPGILISTLIIFIGIFLLVMFFVLKKHNKRSTRVLYLGLFAIIIGTFMFTDSKFLQVLLGDEYLYHMISETCMLLIVVPLMLFMGKSYKNSCSQTVIKILCSLGLLNFIICYSLNLFNICDYHESLILTHLTYILCVLYIIYVSAKSLIIKRKDEMFHTLGLLCICMGCVIDIVLLYFSSIVETTFFTRVGVLVFLFLEGIQLVSEFLKVYRKQERVLLLQKLAYEDGLTELLNRTSFTKDMEELKNVKHGLIAVFDVNNLKMVNDTYGHSEGDNLIITVAEAIKDNLSSIGKCYRIGGDEFVFISEKKIAEEEFKKYLKKLNRSINIYNKTSNKRYTVSTALGYSLITDKLNIDKAFKKADSNMYENKKKMKKNQK